MSDKPILKRTVCAPAYMVSVWTMPLFGLVLCVSVHPCAYAWLAHVSHSYATHLLTDNNPPAEILLLLLVLLILLSGSCWSIFQFFSFTLFFFSFSLLLPFFVLFFLFSRPTSSRAVHSSRRVHFERINTVPIKGHRAGRRGFRRHQSLSRTLLRYSGAQEAWRGSSHTQHTHYASKHVHFSSLISRSVRFGVKSSTVVVACNRPSTAIYNVYLKGKKPHKLSLMYAI